MSNRTETYAKELIAKFKTLIVERKTVPIEASEIDKPQSLNLSSMKHSLIKSTP